MVINISFVDKNIKIISDGRKKPSIIEKIKKFIAKLKNLKSKNNDVNSSDKNAEQTETIEEKTISSEQENISNIDVVSRENNLEKESENINTVNNSNKSDEIISENALSQTSEAIADDDSIDDKSASDNDNLEKPNEPENAEITENENLEKVPENKKLGFFAKMIRSEKKLPITDLSIPVISENNAELNLVEFIDEIVSNKSIFSREIVSNIKSEKKFLVLPDELIGFDSVILPSIRPWKNKELLKTKMKVEFKDFSNLNTTYKPIRKIKPNAIFAIQFIRQRYAKVIIDNLRKRGVKINGINYYSSCLCDFYSQRLILPKGANLIVRIDEKHTTIIAICHSFLLLTLTIPCGERDLILNSQCRFDEHSKKNTAYKFICYQLAKSGDESDNGEIDSEIIEKKFPQSKTNMLAPQFIQRNVGARELLREKIDEMINFLKTSNYKLKVDRIVIDTNNDKLFDQLKVSDAVQISFSEKQIFERNRQNPLFKFKKIKTIKIKKFSWRDLWKKSEKKA